MSTKNFESFQIRIQRWTILLSKSKAGTKDEPNCSDIAKFLCSIETRTLPVDGREATRTKNYKSNNQADEDGTYDKEVVKN